MSLEQNKEIARRIPLELFGQGRVEVVDELVSPDIKNHGDNPPGIPEGRDGLKAIAAALRKGFPDIKVRVDLQIAEGDYVVTHEIVSGTQTGLVFGMPATGKRAEWSEIHIVKIAGGKMTEHWGIVDMMSTLRQLGLAPTPEAASAAR